jgi:putative ABC transport system permease protein
LVRLGPVDWTVTGHFAANGSAFESEIWADLDAVRAAFDREGEVQSLRLRLTEPAALDRLRAAVESAADGPVAVLPEAALYAG